MALDAQNQVALADESDAGQPFAGAIVEQLDLRAGLTPVR
jgi:hypothetical protein